MNSIDSRSSSSDVHVRKMHDLIQEMYAERVTLDTLSVAIGRQPTYLGRLFRQTEGMTVHECVTRVRLERAAELIRQGIKVEAVALTVGYHSKKNFYIQFKRRFQTTPERYGRQCRDVPETAAPSAVERDTSMNGMQPPLGATASRYVLDWRLMQTIDGAVQLGRASQQLAVQRFARSTVAMFLTNELGRYMAANPAAVLLTRYSMTQLADLGPNDLFGQCAGVDAKCLWQAALPIEGPLANAVLRRKDGDAVTVQVVSMPNLLWGRPEMTSLLAAWRDGSA